jgi:hypothetical protein
MLIRLYNEPDTIYTTFYHAESCYKNLLLVRFGIKETFIKILSVVRVRRFGMRPRCILLVKV